MTLISIFAFTPCIANQSYLESITESKTFEILVDACDMFLVVRDRPHELPQCMILKECCIQSTKCHVSSQDKGQTDCATIIIKCIDIPVNYQTEKQIIL